MLGIKSIDIADRTPYLAYDPTIQAGKEDKPMTTMKTQRKIVMRACPRCHGDLLHDDYEDEFVCLQCGRRADLTSGQPIASEPDPIEVLTPKPVVVRTRAEARRHRKAA